MLTAIALSLLGGAILGGGGVLVATRGDRANKHDAAMEEARAEAMDAAASAGKEAVTAALAPALVELEGMRELARQVPAYCLSGAAEYSEAACVAHHVCTRAALGDESAAVGCDRALNTWESERQIAVVEAGGADGELRRERVAIFGRRK